MKYLSMFRSVVLKNLKEKIDIYSFKKKKNIGEIINIFNHSTLWFVKNIFAKRKKEEKINENCSKISIKVIKHEISNDQI